MKAKQVSLTIFHLMIPLTVLIAIMKRSERRIIITTITNLRCQIFFFLTNLWAIKFGLKSSIYFAS
jgi:hypothetical protein